MTAAKHEAGKRRFCFGDLILVFAPIHQRSSWTHDGEKNRMRMTAETANAHIYMILFTYLIFKINGDQPIFASYDP